MKPERCSKNTKSSTPPKPSAGPKNCCTSPTTGQESRNDEHPPRTRPHPAPSSPETRPHDQSTPERRDGTLRRRPPRPSRVRLPLQLRTHCLQRHLRASKPPRSLPVDMDRRQMMRKATTVNRPTDAALDK